MATPEPKIITQGSTSVQNTLSESIKFISSFKEGGEKFSKVTEAILYMICRDIQPISRGRWLQASIKGNSAFI